MSKEKLIIYCDGGSRGNPGPAGLGAVIYDEDKNKVFEISEFLGVTTNNQAEYKGVLQAIKKAKELKAKELTFYLDSELIVKQMNGQYRVKNRDLIPLYMEIRKHVLEFQKVEFNHVRREYNKEADALANMAMDEHGPKKKR
ncbi:MAG TPA: ribonuclease HI family protein [Patescibacteria group bacterium]|nr:ribonuclease HI family protein [Patescibacteria group bacterium]